MTPLDNFQRLMRREHPRRIPLDLPMTPPIVREMQRRTGHGSAREAFGLDFAHVGVGPSFDRAAWLAALTALGVTLPDPVDLGNFGMAWAIPPRESLGAADHLREMLHPLSVVTTVAQLEALPWPDLDDPAMGATLPQRVADAHALGLAVDAGLECTIFELAWYARGMEQLFLDLLEDNGIGAWLLDWHTRRSVRAATLLAHAGVDVLGLGDDVGTQVGMMMAPDFWRQHLKPRLAAVIAAAHDHCNGKRIWIKYHSDGDIRPILDDLIEIGVDILNPVQPECMPLDEVIPQYQDRLAFWGMIGTQTTMPFGSPADVRAAVDQVADFARRGAATIIAPTHVLEPDVPWDNITTLVEHTQAIDLHAAAAGLPG